MGSCLSCPEKESIPDNHQSKFKVINVDDDGNELGSGVMELTDAELVLHTHRRDDVRWPYLCLRRYGYDSNLFSFESGRRCQTGQGIFAFKCARAEEIFNMLQEVMHSHSISVVEEAVLEPSHQAALTPAGTISPIQSSPVVASTRLPSVGEESTHPLLVADEAVSLTFSVSATPPPPPRVRGEPPPPTPTPSRGHRCCWSHKACVCLGPTPVQRQLMERRQKALKDAAEHQETNGHGEKPTEPEPAATHSNGSSAPRRPPARPPHTRLQNVNNSAQRRTALLDYENLPALPPVWEARKPSSETRRRSSHNYVNTENVTAPLSAHRPDTARRRVDGPTIFNFDFRRPLVSGHSDNPTHRAPPPRRCPHHPTRRTELYALIDIERTAAMSNLQKARPRDDGTSRKTRHNSTELPTKSTA
uniref:Fibroblast growth factor receptor substrate 2b n=1 Tax=Maylandia zebra TaxID=106582 RepID=A0A3P9DFK5_9CICH